MEKQRKSGKNEMQLKTGRKAWKNSKTRFSQTVRKQFATLRISQCVGNQFRIAKLSSPNTLYLCEIRLSQNLSEISHCQNSQCVGNPCEFRNANFAMRISQCQFRNANFAMPISQCQFRNANFARPIHCSFVSHKASKP